MNLSVVDIEATPNPNALKFLLDQPVLENGTRSFTLNGNAADDPVVAAIAGITGLVSVFYMNQFITVTKAPETSWSMVMDKIKLAIETIDPSNIAEVAAETSETENGDGEGLLPKVEAVLNTRVMPYLANDGGSLQIVSMEGNELKIKYQGACGSCPSSTAGTLHAIQSMLRHLVDPNIEVIAT